MKAHIFYGTKWQHVCGREQRVAVRLSHPGELRERWNLSHNTIPVMWLLQQRSELSLAQTNDGEPKFWRHLKEANKSLLNSVSMIYIQVVTTPLLYLGSLRPQIWHRHCLSVMTGGFFSRWSDPSLSWTQHPNAWLPPGKPPSVNESGWTLPLSWRQHYVSARPLSLDVWCVFLWHDTGATPDWLLFGCRSLHIIDAGAHKHLPQCLQHIRNMSPCFSPLLEYPDFIPSILTKSYFFLKKTKSNCFHQPNPLTESVAPSLDFYKHLEMFLIRS